MVLRAAQFAFHGSPSGNSTDAHRTPGEHVHRRAGRLPGEPLGRRRDLRPQHLHRDGRPAGVVPEADLALAPAVTGGRGRTRANTAIPATISVSATATTLTGRF